MNEDAAPSAGRLFADALDEAIQRRGLTLSALSRRLGDRGTPVSVPALSSWRAGRRRPERMRSLDALENLEDLLRLPTGHLTARLGPSRRVRPDRTRPFEEIVVPGDALREMKHRLGLTDEPDLDLVGESHVVEIDDDPSRWSVSFELHWRGRVEGAHRALAMIQLDDPTEDPPALSMLSGARIREHGWDTRSGFALWELVLDRPLQIGHTARTSYRIDVVERSPLPGYRVVTEGQTSWSALEVRWTGRSPTHLELHHEADDGVAAPVVLAAGSGVHRVETGFGPGAFGFEWTW